MISPHPKTLIEALANPTHKDRELITKAYHFAENAHREQKRNSGEPYFNHVFATAKNIADLGMPSLLIAAGLLHDVIEDTDVTEKDFEKEFGKELLYIVRGVTKLGKVKYRGMERSVENLRKFFVAMAEDMRVLVVKLCDRLHNAETLEFVRPDKRERIAKETLEIYAPLANRLGMGLLKGRLEDAAFPYAHPKEYKLVKDLLSEKKGISEKYLTEIEKVLKKEMKKHGIENFAIDKRVKHLYSLYKKLLRYDMDIEKVHDIMALRVVVNTVEQCYHTLGMIHGLWRPLPGRIKDYIALPKPNGYKSLHTTIFTGTGGIAEIQIRTKQMHDEAEYGVAAHFAYKEKIPLHKNDPTGQFAWIKELSEAQKKITDVDGFFENLSMDFFRDRVFALTPKGDIIDLPEGASTLDFAYAVHTSIGSRARGARVNGKYVSLDTKLKSGDLVEIDTAKNAHPSEKWLEYTKTSKARARITRYLKAKETLDSIIPKN